MPRSALAVPVVLGLLLALLAAPATARARQGPTLKLTIAARECPDYASITANRARNDIQESLKDLGADSAYAAGEPIDPDVEASSQPACQPIPDWRFTLGTGIRSRAVSGPWGSLSVVTGAFPTEIVTRPSTPLLSTTGAPTGRDLAGAVTIALTDEQADLAARSSRLWIQGGTPSDPILDAANPGVYGFGALRCAIDDLNGDNVEWISYPLGQTHVFCFAYYVKPPPTSGTIVVRKEVEAPADAASQAFPFTGNVSFTPDGTFTVGAAPGAPGQTTFYRAEVRPGEAPWTFREEVPPGWALTAVTCTSATGGSTTSTDFATAAAAVTLAPGDTVTCTFRDRLVPPAAGLLLAKVTTGAVGTFGFAVDGPQTATATATTTAEGIEVPAAPALSLPPGDYRVGETPPARRDGRWVLDGVRCNGSAVEDVQPVHVTLAAGQGTVCTFANRFVPKGTIRLRKVTTGGVGTTGFVLTPVHHTPPVSLAQSATTTREGEAVLARGDDTSTLPLGRYVLQETTPSDRGDGTWSLEAVTCNGVPVPSEQGQVRVRLTTDAPDLDCTFRDRFARGQVESGGGAGGGGGGGRPPSPVDPQADLRVVKRAVPTTVTVGGVVRYTVTVVNHGPAAAHHVTLVEVDPRGRARIRARTSRGTCVGTRPAICHLGTMRPGARATVTVRQRQTAVGRVRNTVATNTSTDEASLADNRASATVRVRARPRFTG